jgi:hypothetical protein
MLMYQITHTQMIQITWIAVNTINKLPKPFEAYELSKMPMNNLI